MFDTELQAWIMKHNIAERTVRAFWNCFEQYKVTETLDFSELFFDYNEKKLSVEFDSVSLKWDDDVRLLYRLKLRYANCDIGYYLAVYQLDGTLVDDVLMNEFSGSHVFLKARVYQEFLEEFSEFRREKHLAEDHLLDRAFEQWVQQKIRETRATFFNLNL